MHPNRLLRRLLAAVACGGMLLQTPGCTDLALAVGSLSSAITAGGVLYLVARVAD